MYNKLKAEIKNPNLKKRHEHIAVKEQTFMQFRELKDTVSDDAFVKRLLNTYVKVLVYMEKKKEKSKHGQ